MVEEEVVYELDGKPTKFRIRRITYGEYQKVMGQISNVELIGGVTKGKMDMTRLVDELMKVSVTGENGADFHKLDVDKGMDLQSRVLTLNGMGGDLPFRSQ